MAKVANDTVLAETVAEARAWLRHGRFWIVLLLAGFLIGLTGPFGTFDSLPLLPRIAYWTGVVLTTFWLGYLTSFAVATLFEEYGVHALASLGIGAVTSGIAVTIWLALIHRVVFAAPVWAEFCQLLPYVLVICISAALVSELAATGEVTPSPRPAVDEAPAWIEQLPNHLGRELILLHAQDHYLRVETALGQTLIRTTLQDAARELGDHGVRLHRSWWVALDAVAAYRYQNGAPVVVLQDGRVLPIGRTYRRAVKAALR